MVLLTDLHCHSKNLGVFAYGCETSAVPAMRLKVWRRKEKGREQLKGRQKVEMIVLYTLPSLLI